VGIVQLLLIIKYPWLTAQTKTALPLNYEIYLVKDGQIGHMNEKQEWNGLVGDLVKGVS
jgi:hypothetical protein